MSRKQRTAAWGAVMLLSTLPGYAVCLQERALLGTGLYVVGVIALSIVGGVGLTIFATYLKEHGHG